MSASDIDEKDMIIWSYLCDEELKAVHQMAEARKNFRSYGFNNKDFSPTIYKQLEERCEELEKRVNLIDTLRWEMEK